MTGERNQILPELALEFYKPIYSMAEAVLFENLLDRWIGQRYAPFFQILAYSELLFEHYKAVFSMAEAVLVENRLDRWTR